MRSTGQPPGYAPTAETTASRARERISYDRELVHEVLDEALVCHLAFIADGPPVVLPTIHARAGERVYVHGSTGSRPLLLAATGGLDVCLSVTLVDGLVLARSAFHHSVNYRSVVAHGTARVVTDDGERRTALGPIVDRAAAGRSGRCRPANAREMAATAVLALDLEAVSAKRRAGPPRDDEADLSGPYWAGVVPITVQRGAPIPAPDLAPGVPTPAGLARPPHPSGADAQPLLDLAQ